MIYCNLVGGLGNLLFQVAAVKSFSIDMGVECSFPNLRSHYDYMNIDSQYNPYLRHSHEYDIMLNKLITTPPLTQLPTIQYPFEYSSLIPHDNAMIFGFFQSEKYFKHNREKLSEFTKVPELINDVIKNKYSDILAKRTTSIHVRRGDYVRFPNHHPMQSIEYYLNGIELLKDKTDVFVIFSDDIEWCKANLNIENAIYIENEKDYIEMYLMSLCNNNIIANSSFSWWGAWLNENINKTVIGPKNWFGDAIQHNTGDILPETWIKL